MSTTTTTTHPVPRLKRRYREEIIPALREQFGALALQRIEVSDG